MKNYTLMPFCDATMLTRVLDRLPQALRTELAKRDILRVGQLYAEWRRNGLDWVSHVQGVGPKTIMNLSELCGECERRERESEERKAEAASSIDWEQRRYDVAREALNVLLNINDMDTTINQAIYAVEAADALIEELKKHTE